MSATQAHSRAGGQRRTMISPDLFRPCGPMGTGSAVPFEPRHGCGAPAVRFVTPRASSAEMCVRGAEIGDSIPVQNSDWACNQRVPGSKPQSVSQSVISRSRPALTPPPALSPAPPLPEHRRQSISSPRCSFPPPSGSRLGLRQHRLRGVQGGRRPPCSGCASSAQRQWRSLGARSMLDARSLMISTLRSQVSFATGVAHARLRLSGRYASAARAFISPTAFEQARGGALGAGGGRVGFAGGGLFMAHGPLLSRPRFRPSRGRAGVTLGLDGCEVRLCDPCARVRPCVPCVSRVSPGSPLYDFTCRKDTQTSRAPNEHKLSTPTCHHHRTSVRCLRGLLRLTSSFAPLRTMMWTP